MQKSLIQKEEEDNVIDFKNRKDLKLVIGGKEPPSTGSNWLSDLELGTIFLVKDKNSPLEINLPRFLKVGETEKAVVLKGSGSEDIIFIDPGSFCNRFRLVEELGTIKEEDTKDNEEEKENNE